MPEDEPIKSISSVKPYEPTYNGQLATSTRRNETKRKGEDEGSNSRPPQTATKPDQYEHVIISQAEKFIEDEISNFKIAIDGYSVEIENINSDLRKTNREVEAAVSDGLDKITSEIESIKTLNRDGSSDPLKKRKDKEDFQDETKDGLAYLRKNEIEAIQHLNWFKREHNLTRPAKYPTAEEQYFKIGIIISCILMEAFINAVFFKNERGLLGGAFIAGLVSFINIAAAGILGLMFRFVSHVNIIKKVIGWLSFLFWIVVALFFNTMLSCYRHEYQYVTNPRDFQQLTDAATKAKSAALTIFTFNYPFGDIMSFLLFCISFIICILAFYEGYSLTDAYWGYRRPYEDYRKAEQAFKNKVQTVRTDIINKLVEKESELIRLQALVVRIEDNIDNLRRAIKMSMSKKDAIIDTIIKDMQAIIVTYRVANEAARSPNPAPEYFKIIPQINTDTSIGRLELEKLEAEMKTLEQSFNDKISNNTTRLAALRKTILLEHQAFLGQRFDEYLKNDVENKANDLIAQIRGSSSINSTRLNGGAA